MKAVTVRVHRQKVASVNTKWAHTNDRPLLFLEQSQVPNTAQSGQGGSEARKEEAEFNGLSNLVDSLPDGSTDQEDLALEKDPRHIISQSLMKALLEPVRRRMRQPYRRKAMFWRARTVVAMMA